MSPPTRKRRGSGSKKGKKGKKGKQRRKSTKSSTRRKASYADGETAPFWNKALERVYAQGPTADAKDAAGRLYRCGYEPVEWLLLARRAQVELVVLEAHTREQAARARCARES